MDNQSNESDQELDIGSSQTKKPTNRNRFDHKGFVISSEFPGGNLKAALFQEQFRMEGKTALVVEFWGNSDAQVDPLDKTWFYFSVSGIKEIAKMGYQEIIFRFKNANNYRKFIREKRFKPYVAFKQMSQLGEEEWQTLYVSKINILQTQIIEAEFVYTVKADIDCVYFAENVPYQLKDVEKLHRNVLECIKLSSSDSVYYSRQVIARSVDDHPIYMCTLTSMKNVNSHQEKPLEKSSNSTESLPLFKNKPEIVITARVHPSETSSSFCVEGIIENLVKNYQLELLMEFFIFRIVPMVNPDGVENGHYRLDNYLQNLNRYYGHSDQTKTPPIFAIEKLITNLREKSKLFFFMDIHGHNSPKPSFIFGNFTQNLYQTLQNKTFVKIMEVLCEGSFDSTGCQFSKKHMSVKQKYDEHSKQASARVYAYRGNSQQQNGQLESKNTLFVEHSYTLQIHPYVISDLNIRRSLGKKQSKEGSNSYKNLSKINQTKRAELNTIQVEPTQCEILDQYKKIGCNVLIAILDIIGAKAQVKIHIDDCSTIRKRNFKQISKLLEFYDRSKRLKVKEINRELFQRYYQRWNFLEYFKQYLQSNYDNQGIKKRLKSCFIYQYYEEWTLKNLKIEEMNAKKAKVTAKIGKEKLTDNKIEGSQIEDNQASEKEKESAQKSNLIKQTQQKTKVLQAKQFEMIQKIQGKEIHKSSYNSNLGSYKKAINTEASQIQLLQRKIRKLMFRHRTEIEIPDSSNEKYYYESINHKIETNTIQDEAIKSRKVTINPKQAHKKNGNNNRLQPLNKTKKDRIYLIRNEQLKYQPQFNDLNVISRQEISTQKRISGLEGLQPRIQEFVRKLSQHKQDLNTIEHDKADFLREDLTKIKSTGMTLNQRKINSRGSHQYLKECHRIAKEEAEEQVTLYYNHAVESLVTQVRESPKVAEEYDQEGSLLHGRLTRYNKSVKSRIQRVECNPNTANEQEVQKIVRSFRVLAGEASNKVQFIQKAKKILSEKKRQLKTIQEPYLPIISEFDPFGGQKKTKT